MSETRQLNITSIADLKKVAEGEIVELPNFTEEIPFIARLGRPSMLKMVADGKIENKLLNTATSIFNGTTEGKEDKNENFLKEMHDVMLKFADACLLEPTLQDIKGEGVELTDEQLMAIFNYSQRGVSALEKFHQEPEYIEGDKPKPAVQNKTKRTNRNK